MFAKFEEGGLLSKTCNNTEISNESGDNSAMPQLFSEESSDAISSGDESDAEPMSTDMLEYICDGSQSRLSINSREARYMIRVFKTKSSGMERRVIINTKHG